MMGQALLTAPSLRNKWGWNEEQMGMEWGWKSEKREGMENWDWYIIFFKKRKKRKYRLLDEAQICIFNYLPRWIF